MTSRRVLKLDPDANDEESVLPAYLDRIAEMSLDERFDRLLEMQNFALELLRQSGTAHARHPALVKRP